MNAAVTGAAVAAQAIPILEQAVVTIVTGEIIEQASGEAAQLAKAQSILAVASGFQQLNNGGTLGLQGLQTGFLALVKTVKDEAVQEMINGLFAALLTKISAYATGGLLSRVGAMVANDFWAYVEATASGYVDRLTPKA